MLRTLVPLVVAVVLIAVFPGPNLIAVTMASVRDRRSGLWTALGVSAGDVVWAAAALVGLGAALAHSRPVFMTLKWLGAAYLMFLAVRMWRATPDLGAATTPSAPSQRRPFAQGVMVDLANPKAAVFFTSLYASVLPADLDLWSAAVVLTTTTAIIAGWYVTVALLMSRPRTQRIYRRANRAVGRASAGVMGALGIRLVLSD